MALSSIAIEQSKGMTNTMVKAKQLLDYLATYQDAIIHFQALVMILNVQSDTLYLSESEARSRACSHLLWVGPRTTATPSNSVAHSTRYAPSYVLLSLPLPKHD
jgi:hypothetical protein